VGLSVATSSANVAFGDANSSAIVDNKGVNDAFVAVGGAGVTATTTALRIPAGSAVAIATGGNAKLAAVTASSTTTLLITTGTGLPALTYGSSGGSSANASVGATGSAVPGSGTYLGGTNGGNLQGVAVNGSGQVAIQAPPSLPLPSGAATAANQTVNDGTNTAKVEAASTRPAAADKALVVTLSPNPPTYCPNSLPVNITASTDLHSFTNTGFICSIVLVVAGQEQVSIIEGTGTVCATGTAVLWGASTADSTHGMPLAANGGMGPSFNPPLPMKTSADHLCILKSGSNLLSGAIWYADAS